MGEELYRLHLLHWRAVCRKQDAYLIEHGRQSITRQIQRMGLRTLVVDRDGTSYDHDKWYLSGTFWQRDQEGLLIDDNQTQSSELDILLNEGLRADDQVDPTHFDGRECFPALARGERTGKQEPANSAFG